MKLSIGGPRAHGPVLMLACGLALGCGGKSVTGPDQDEFSPYGSAQIQGQATTLSGQPLDSVRVAVRYPSERAAEFTSAPGLSGSDGRYQASVFRILPTSNLIDTVTVMFIATVSQARFRRQDGSFPVDTIPLVVRFVAPGGTVSPLYINPRLPVF